MGRVRVRKIGPYLLISTQKCIYNNTLKAIELCVLKIADDCMPLLDLLGIILHPQSK
jgi:hypothetical protein